MLIQYLYPVLGQHYIRLVQGFPFLAGDAMRQGFNTLEDIQDSVQAMQRMNNMGKQMGYTQLELRPIPNILDKLRPLLK